MQPFAGAKTACTREVCKMLIWSVLATKMGAHTPTPMPPHDPHLPLPIKRHAGAFTKRQRTPWRFSVPACLVLLAITRVAASVL